jgi:Fic family protein
MATLHEKLADALTQLKVLSGGNKRRIFKSGEFDRQHRELLLKNGYLADIINGWVMVTKPDARPGDTVTWYSSYWEFVREYLNERFAKDWILSPETSIPLLAENMNVPQQIVVQSPGASNRPVELLLNTSIFAYRTKQLPPFTPTDKDGLRLYPAAEALAAAVPALWNLSSAEAIAVLGSLRGTSQLLAPLLRDANVAGANRIAGALKKIGREGDAEEIVKTMEAAGHQIRPVDPFERPVPMSVPRPALPIVTRTKLLWAELRDQVLQGFTTEPRIINNRAGYMESVDELYTADAYHSLSIEGYHVTEELIERVRSGNWNPDQNEKDKKQTDALAARGYWQAFQKVRKAVEDIIGGGNAAEIVESNVQAWYRELFQPSAAAGLIPIERLAGWRQHPIYLTNSPHVPASWESLPDAMEAYFECMQNEKDSRVRAVLGHFVFTWIHPFADGNGRCGRFIMNCMMASGGFPWTIIPVDRRNDYLQALEAASGDHDAKPLAAFIHELSKLEPPPPTRAPKSA